MSPATERADALFMRLMLSDDRFGLPPHVSVVAADVDHAAKIVWRSVREGMPTVVVGADGGELLVSPSARFERIVDWMRRRSCVRVEARRDGEAAFRMRCRADRATLERELLSV